MTPGAICECGKTFKTKGDARDEKSMSRLISKSNEHALNEIVAGHAQVSRNIFSVVTGEQQVAVTHHINHGDYEYVEITAGDERFDQAEEV